MDSWSWIYLTLMASAAQAVRTGGQKHLTRSMSTFAVSLVRFLYGLPFVIAYFGFLLYAYDREIPTLTTYFLAFCLLGGVGQILATALLVYLFSFRNFAVGTTYARTEAFLTAAAGALLFNEAISLQGWLAIASLSVREAALSFGDETILFPAALTLLKTVLMQTAILGAYIAISERDQIVIMLREWKVATFVGATSALGSIGWFTAFTLQKASFVKTLGQVEFIFTLLISILFFRERTSPGELAGMLLVVVGIVYLLAIA